MKSDALRTQSFLFSPKVKRRIDLSRLTIDVIGLGAVYLIGPFIPSSYQSLVFIYSILAWVTVLTLDPSRLPEASTTKIKQRLAFKMGLMCLPLYSGIFYFSFFFKGALTINQPVTAGVFVGGVINAVLYETYFRNIAQVMLRKWGLPAWGAILVQSILFSFMFYTHHSYAILIGSLAISLINGWISYKTRSIKWNFLITMAWILVIHFS